jgi:hypothetical protein
MRLKIYVDVMPAFLIAPSMARAENVASMAAPPLSIHPHRPFTTSFV